MNKRAARRRFNARRLPRARLITFMRSVRGKALLGAFRRNGKSTLARTLARLLCQGGARLEPMGGGMTAVVCQQFNLRELGR